MKYLYLVFTFLFALPCLLVAQSADPNITPPTPEAMAFHRSGVSNINNYSGSADISIDIFNFKVKDLSLPIKLSYVANNGVKVQERASWVGLGWALSAGGAVSREIRNRPDDFKEGYYLSPDIPERTLANKPYFEDIHYGAIDGEPDLFRYNAPGISGSFMIYKDHDARSILHIPYSDNKIEFTHSTTGQHRFTEFTITNSQGVRYTFSAMEEMISTSLSGASPDNRYKVSSWYLTNISNHDNTASINIEYADENGNLYNIGTNALVDIYSETRISRQNSNTETISANRTKVRQLKPSRIYDSRGYEVNFIQSSIDRCDFKNTKYLDKIEVNYNGQRVKSYDFDYSYFTENGTMPVTSPCSYVPYSINAQPLDDGNHKWRLKLNKVTEIGSDDAKELSPYQFEYEQSQYLPSRYSMARDHWGYYNGAVNNTTLEPVQYIDLTGYLSHSSKPFVKYGSADRDSNFEFGKAAILTKITYPTGGYTELQYEANTCSNPEIESDKVSQKVEFTLDTPNEIATSITIDLIERPFTELVVTAFPYFPTEQCNVFIDFENASTGQTKTIDFAAVNNILLHPGTYDVTISPTDVNDPNGGSCFSNDVFQLFFDWENQVETVEKEVGGGRVASIVNCSGATDCTTHFYDYLREDGSSSGYLASIPTYGYTILGDFYDESYVTTWARTFSSNEPMLSTLGSFVGYSKVTESTGLGGNGKVVSMYISPEFIKDEKFGASYVTDSNEKIDIWPGSPYSARDYLRGKTINTNIYDNNSTLLKSGFFAFKGTFKSSSVFGLEEVYEIEAQSPKSIPGVRVVGTICEDDAELCSISVNVYSIYSGRGYVKQQIQKQIEGEIESRIVTTYNWNSDHQVIDSEQVEYPDGSIRERESFYNFNATNEAQGILSSSDYDTLQEMYEDRNIIVPYYKRLSNISEKEILNRQLFRYNSNYRLDEVLSSKGSSELVRSVKYLSYGVNGLPTAYVAKDGRVHSFSWSNYQVSLSGVAESAFPDGFSKTMLNDPSGMDGVYDVKLYEYDALGRIKSIVDVNGQATSYDYDEFGNLIMVKDDNENILKKVTYNYKSEEGGSN